jgi:hypothetical protein
MLSKRGQPFIKTVMALKDHAAISARALHRRTIQQDAAGCGGFKPRHHVQDRGLAAARGAKQAEELALCQVKAEVAHSLPGASAA